MTAETAPDIRFRRLAGRAPTAVAAKWRDPDDLNAGRRSPREIKGTRASDPLVALSNRSGSLVTAAHLRAAGRFLADYEVGVLGARQNMPEKAGGRGSPGAMYPSEQQCARLRSVQIAERAVGPTGVRILHHVVCGIPDPLRRDVASYARRFGINAQVAMGLLVATLERLVEHYGDAVPSQSP